MSIDKQLSALKEFKEWLDERLLYSSAYYEFESGYYSGLTEAKEKLEGLLS